MGTWGFRRLALGAGALAWLAAVGVGFGALWSYGAAPGAQGVAPAIWPTQSSVQRSVEKPALLVMLHPHCPCSRATLSELARLMAQADGRLAATAIFVRPEGMSADWVDGDLWRSAAAIPGVSVVRDDGGVEARRFAAQTSGQTLLYGADGRLRFEGGITPSRGHSGDNFGRSAILAILDGRHDFVDAKTPVFGCHLTSPILGCDDEGGGSCRT